MPDVGKRLFEELMRFKPDGLSASGWAVKAGISRTFWNDLKRHGNPSRRTLEKLLDAADSSLAEFEALHIGETPAKAPTAAERLEERRNRAWGHAPLPPLPQIASSFGGEWGEPGSGIELTELRTDTLFDRLARPASLAADEGAYALIVVGDSMWPRFRPGRRIAVSPRSPVAIGDDVVLRLKNAHDRQMVLIKELVRRTSAFIELRQFNPCATFRVEAAEVEAIHKVAGELF